MTVLAVQHSGIGGVGRRHWRRRVMALAERPPGLHQRMQRRGCGAMESRSAQASGQLRYEPIDQKHTESALELVLSRYENERAHVPALPPGAEFRDSLGRAIEVHDCRVAVKKADVDDIPSVADIHTRHFCTTDPRPYSWTNRLEILRRIFLIGCQNRIIICGSQLPMASRSGISGLSPTASHSSHGIRVS